MANVEEVVKAAALVIARAALNLFAVDQHRWSDRPCPTCRQITAMIGEPWGCYAYQLRKKSTDHDGPGTDAD
ncbi:hypothetical protein LCGC14_2468450 [marine sediment metagenome]|uniref:Uncharacterized protein n=1 Tax=marine sediment metagenome TaxID=412755 RepID=A0A0F9BB18_9ZZZZ